MIRWWPASRGWRLQGLDGLAGTGRWLNARRQRAAGEGTGMMPERRTHPSLWRHSNRRAAGQTRGAHHGPDDRQPVQIGGKEIDLPYARAVCREHRGDLSIGSAYGQQTRVVIDLPAPTVRAI